LVIPLVTNLDIASLEEDLNIDFSVFDTDAATEVEIDGRQGKRISEKFDYDEIKHPHGGGEITIDKYPVPYSNAPVILKYFHPVDDDLMEPYMEMLHDTWQFDQ